MLSLLYFDTEDFCSPPESPVHRLPGQMADIMHRHGFLGSFHIHGEKVRFMERHGQNDVIESIRKHDVSLHCDRGSIHPTTAEEVSNLGWFDGVERVLFRELTGFQTLHRVFGKCTSITQHGGTFAAQIVYAAGKMGYPFFYSPFSIPGRGVCWYCNNLLMAGARAPGIPFFDRSYCVTPEFEGYLARVDPFLGERAKQVDYHPMFGCHPVNTMMEAFPDKVNFAVGASPPRREWKPPTPVEGVSIPLILENFERLIVELIAHPDVEWTTVAGIADRYGNRPVTVSDGLVLEGAKAVVENRGPTYTSVLTAGELLYLFARRTQGRAETYEVPQVMGPTETVSRTQTESNPVGAPDRIAGQILDAVNGSGYLPASLTGSGRRVSPEAVLIALACEAVGTNPNGVSDWNPSLDAIPNLDDAIEKVKGYEKWTPHGPQYNQAGILEHFRLQAWTLKPAMPRGEYPAGVGLGRDLNAMIV